MIFTLLRLDDLGGSLLLDLGSVGLEGVVLLGLGSSSRLNHCGYV